MIPRELPYNKRIRIKTHLESKVPFIVMQIVYISLENGPKLIASSSHSLQINIARLQFKNKLDHVQFM